MDRPQISCEDARRWVHDQLDTYDPTKGLRVHRFSRYDSTLEPPEILEDASGLSLIASNTVRHVWKSVGQQFEVNPD